MRADSFSLSFPHSSVNKESACNAGDPGSIGKIPWRRDRLPTPVAPHSSTLAWKIPWMEEPGGLQSMGSHRVGHDWSDLAAAAAAAPTPVFLAFLYGSAGKESTCNVGDLGLIPGLGRSPGEGKGYPLQYSGLENSMDPIVHRVANSQTRLSDFHFLFHCSMLWFPREEYWGGLPFPSPGIEEESLASPALAGGFFTTEPTGKPKILIFQISHWWIFIYYK